MTDHHDFGYHDDDPLPFEHTEPFDDHPAPEPFGDQWHAGDGWDEHLGAAETHEDLPVPVADELTAPDTGTDLDGTDLDVATLAAADPVEVFPPALDVGDLPEPVDGFPWIDTGSLGVVDTETHDTAAHDAGVDPVRPEDLAAYAGTDLPPGADPWQALADSDDPATGALARWWSPN